jgi:hypothetical protein
MWSEWQAHPFRILNCIDLRNSRQWASREVAPGVGDAEQRPSAAKTGLTFSSWMFKFSLLFHNILFYQAIFEQCRPGLSTFVLVSGYSSRFSTQNPVLIRTEKYVLQFNMRQQIAHMSKTT